MCQWNYRCWLGNACCATVIYHDVYIPVLVEKLLLKLFPMACSLCRNSPNEFRPNIECRLGLMIYNGIRNHSSQCTMKIHLHMSSITRLQPNVRHIWDLPVLHYHKIIVIYPYPCFVVITQLFSRIIFINDWICILIGSTG